MSNIIYCSMHGTWKEKKAIKTYSIYSANILAEHICKTWVRCRLPRSNYRIVYDYVRQLNVHSINF